MTDAPIMTDGEVAALLRISKATLRRRIARPVKGELDLTSAAPVIYGGRRFWLRRNVERMIGLK